MAAVLKRNKPNPIDDDPRFARLKTLFKGTEPKAVWALSKQKPTGWARIPRALPLIIRSFDVLKPLVLKGRATKGKLLDLVYLDLWCQEDKKFLDGIVSIQSTGVRALSGGLSGTRAVNSWRERVRLIEELGFIKVFSTPVEPIHSVLLLNPHLVLKKHLAHFPKDEALREIYDEVMRQVEIAKGHDLPLLRRNEES